MSKHHNQARGSDHTMVHHNHIPYWKRAHGDWRFWVGVMLMFVAMIVYVMTGDLALRPLPGPPVPAADPVGK